MAAKMTASIAADVLGINRAQWELRNMAHALALHSWHNTPDDETRRAAAKWAVRNWRAYADECNARRDARNRR